LLGGEARSRVQESLGPRWLAPAGERREERPDRRARCNEHRGRHKPAPVPKGSWSPIRELHGERCASGCGKRGLIQPTPHVVDFDGV